MVQMYNNATPDMKFTGYQDTPKAGPQGGGVLTPLFCPLSFVMAEWGSTEDAYLIAGDEFTSIFGQETWEVGSKFFNHANLFAKMYQQKAVRHFVMRPELPDMARAGGRLSLEIVEAEVPQYIRGADGKFLLDSNGDLQPDTPATIDGYKLRWRFDADTAGSLTIGDGAVADGTLTGKEGATSKVYPIMDFQGTFLGSRANRFNINMYQPKSYDGIPVDVPTINANGNMLYRFAVTETPSAGGTVIPWYTELGNEQMDFSFVADALSANDARLGFADNYAAQYTLKGQAYNGANKNGPVDTFHIYDAYLEQALTLLHTVEVDEATDTPAFISEDNLHSVNIMDATDHKGIPYKAIEMAGVSDIESNTYFPGSSASFRLAGGSDGTTTVEALESAVGTICDTFGNGVTLNDMKRYPFHFIMDSGWSLPIKKKLQSLKGKRPDVFVGTGTHTHGNDPLSLLDELAVGSSLAANAALYPESTIFKTEATRESITPWAIKIHTSDLNSQWSHPTTLNYDLAAKMASYWGSSDAVWVKDKAFDTYPNNVITHEILNYKYASLPVREEMWGNQMIAVEYSDVNEIIYSGLQTVNPNDSSILNSVIAVGGTLHATWAAIRTNKHFVGRNMDAGVLINDSDEMLTTYCKGVDTSKVQIVPETQITPEDNDAGYAWTTVAHVTSGGMRTVNTISVTSAYNDGE